MRRYLFAMICLCLAVALVGCSSGGTKSTVSAGSRSAAGQATAALFIQQWSQILWGLTSQQTGTTTPSFNPITLSGVAADGSTYTVTFLPPPPAPPDFFVIRIDITYPDGTTQIIWQSVPQPVPPFPPLNTVSINQKVETPDGIVVIFTLTTDTKGTPFIDDDTIVLEGTATLPDGETQTFTVITDGGTTTVTSDQSDGSHFTMVVPVASRPGITPFEPQLLWPNFALPATGTFTGEGFDIQFTLTSTAGAPGRWSKLTADFGDSVMGDFTLNEDFSGSGQLLQNGEPIALLSWTATGDVDVTYLTAESSATSAVGAALDFLIHRWQTLTGLSGPA